ncbi:MAG: hypothetical protein WBE34_11560 [Candidatus Nitrosopolaris sp.]
MPKPAICTFCKQDGIIVAMDTTVKKDGTYCKSGLAYTVIGVIIKLSHASISAVEKLPFH